MTLWTNAASNVNVTWYSTWYARKDLGGGENGAAGVREPRLPVLPTNTGGAALDMPPAEQSA